MTDETLHTTAPIARPIHPMLVPIPVVCFIGALLTDIMYYVTAEMMWANFSAWLLVVGMIGGALALIALIIDLLTRRLIGVRRPTWPGVLGMALALVLALFNTLIHTRDAWTSVVPIGLILSIIVVLILLATGWLDWMQAYRNRAGVAR